MQLGKRITLFTPRPCYMIFELNDVFSSAGGYDIDIEKYQASLLYNGEIKIFDSLRDLNDHLSNIKVEERMPDIEKKLYKGHLFSSKEFPLESEHEDNVTFVIEKIDVTTCFVEQMLSLSDAAKSIKEEINMLSKNDDTTELDSTNITDYMVFHGKVMPLFYYCYDSEV